MARLRTQIAPAPRLGLVPTLAALGRLNPADTDGDPFRDGTVSSPGGLPCSTGAVAVPCDEPITKVPSDPPDIVEGFGPWTLIADYTHCLGRPEIGFDELVALAVTNYRSLETAQVEALFWDSVISGATDVTAGGTLNLAQGLGRLKAAAPVGMRLMFHVAEAAIGNAYFAQQVRGDGPLFVHGNDYLTFGEGYPVNDGGSVPAIADGFTVLATAIPALWLSDPLPVGESLGDVFDHVTNQTTVFVEADTAFWVDTCWVGIVDVCEF